MDYYNNSEAPRRARTPSEEIEILREQALERSKRLGLESPTQGELEQIASREIVNYGDKLSEQVLDPDFRMEDSEVEKRALDFGERKDEQIDRLVETLAEKGIKNALNIAEKLNNPHLSDDFHQFLVQYLMEGMVVPGLKEGSPLFKALHMKLFEVTLPEITNEGKETFASLVTTMEQFYSGTLSIKEFSNIKNYFALEIALSSSNDDVVFYMAVPAAKVALFEKQLISTFPKASMTLHKEDYNPFNKSGFTVASVAKLDKAGVLPLRTSDKFEQDPLNVILGVFSKIKREGEGAAIQLIINPVGNEINSKYREVLKDVKKGVPINRAMESSTLKISREFFDVTRTMFFGGQSQKIEKKEEVAGESLKVDEVEVQAITEKISSPIINTNIRIIGSAETEIRAKEIMRDLESAFNQFANEPSNRIIFRHMNPSGLKQLLHEFSFRLYSKKQAMALNLKEMTTIFHFPVSQVNVPQLKQSKIISAAAPISMEEEGVFLGRNVHRGMETKVYLPSEDRMRHFYCIGQTGTGKTTLLKNMIIQDIINGKGVCYIDPHGTDIEDVLNAIPENRIQDVIYFDPSDISRPMGLNMLEYDPMHPEQKSFVINELLSIFNKLFDMKTAGGPMFEQYFRNSTALVMDDPESGNTLLDVSRVLADAKFRELKLSRCKNPIVVQFWRDIAAKAGGESSLANMVPYITNKFDVFLSNEIMRLIVSQEKSAFNFRDVMDERKILLVNLAKGRLGDINSHLIGLILVGKIFMAALSRVDSVNCRPPDFYLYIDEFQNVTTDSISAILSEARKYRLGLNIAHQFIAQLDDNIKNAIFGNVGSMAVFRVGAEDAEFLGNQFAPTITPADIMKIPNHNAYVKMLVNGFPAKPFNLEPERPHVGLTETGNCVKQYSRNTYGRDRVELDMEIMEKYKRASPPPNNSIERRPVTSGARPFSQPIRRSVSNILPQTKSPVSQDQESSNSNGSNFSRNDSSLDNINNTSRSNVNILPRQQPQDDKINISKDEIKIPEYGFNKEEEINEFRTSLGNNVKSSPVQTGERKFIVPSHKPAPVVEKDKDFPARDPNSDKYLESID